MADMLEQAATWLDGVRREHASQTVIYERDDRSVQVAATIGQKSYEVADSCGASVWVESTDFLITAADLVIAGIETLPEAGDRIRVEAGGKVRVYEVMAPGGDMSHYTAADPYRTAWRVHTKHVDTERA